MTRARVKDLKSRLPGIGWPSDVKNCMQMVLDEYDRLDTEYQTFKEKRKSHYLKKIQALKDKLQAANADAPPG